jgi:hypothetical protein
MRLDNDADAGVSQAPDYGKSRNVYRTAPAQNDSINTPEQLGSRLRDAYRRDAGFVLRTDCSQAIKMNSLTLARKPMHAGLDGWTHRRCERHRIAVVAVRWSECRFRQCGARESVVAASQVDEDASTPEAATGLLPCCASAGLHRLHRGSRRLRRPPIAVSQGLPDMSQSVAELYECCAGPWRRAFNAL